MAHLRNLHPHRFAPSLPIMSSENPTNGAPSARQGGPPPIPESSKTDPAAFKRLIDKIQDLPTLPSVAMQLINLVRDPRCAAGDIEEVLSCDPSLTMKVMRVTNSAFYGQSHARTLHEAIVMLGFASIRSIILAASVFEAFPGEGRPGFDRVEFWRHSLAVAVAARLLAIHQHSEDVEEAFLAGLLHDIGKIVLDEYSGDPWHHVLQQAKAKNMLLFEAERQFFGFSHAQVGQWLAIKWKLPVAYTAAIFYHHQPSFARQNEQLVAFVHIADIIARKLEIGSGGDSLVPTLDPEAWKQSGLSEATFETVLAAVPEAFTKAKTSFALPGK